MKLIKVLQTLSPELREDNPSYMPEARAGMVLTQDISTRPPEDPKPKGELSYGVIFHVSSLKKNWMEWNQHGPLVKNHGEDNSILQHCFPQTPEEQVTRRWTAINGNRIQEYYVYSDGETILKLTSTGFNMLGLMLLGCTYRLTPNLEVHKKGPQEFTFWFLKAEELIDQPAV